MLKYLRSLSFIALCLFKSLRLICPLYELLIMWDGAAGGFSAPLLLSPWANN